MPKVRRPPFSWYFDQEKVLSDNHQENLEYLGFTVRPRRLAFLDRKNLKPRTYRPSFEKLALEKQRYVDYMHQEE